MAKLQDILSADSYISAGDLISDMPNVLSIVSYKFLPAKMGGQKGIGLFNKFLSRHVNLTCITTKSNDASFAEGYEVQNILTDSKTRYINLFYFFKLKKIIKQKQVTHVILEHPYYGWLGTLLKWSCKVKLVVHSHNIEASRFKSMGKWWWGILWNYEKFTHKKADINFFIQDDDKAYAVESFKLNPARCFTITYGFEMNEAPSKEAKNTARNIIAAQYSIPNDETILLFNGTLDYKPNLDALKIILDQINPALIENKTFKYKIIICGKNLPADYNDLKNYADKNIVYAGFVDDIDLYFKAADIFINPVIDGGGIKTKLVEALGHDLNVVTTASGAIGVPAAITINKMSVLKDDQLDLFPAEIIKANTSFHIQKEFFDHFYWGSIATKAAGIIEKN